MTTKDGQRRIHVYADGDWKVPGAEPSPDGEKTAEQGDVGRKRLVQGESGFYTQVVRLPPGFAAPPHSHDHAEVFMVLSGSCVFDGAEMAERDSTVVDANQAYSFTAGSDGLEFLVVRQGVAGFKEEQ